MKSKQDFVDAYADRLAGMLLMLFAKSENTNMDMAQRGRWMQMEVDRVRPLLREMYAFINEEIIITADGQIPTLDEQVEAIIRQHQKASQDVQKRVVERLRVAFTKKEEKPK